MTRNECSSAGEDINQGPVAWPMESLLLNRVKSAFNSAVPEFPLKDYLSARRELAYEAMYFPHGFPVRVLSKPRRARDGSRVSKLGFVRTRVSWRAIGASDHRGDGRGIE